MSCLLLPQISYSGIYDKSGVVLENTLIKRLVKLVLITICLNLCLKSYVESNHTLYIKSMRLKLLSSPAWEWHPCPSAPIHYIIICGVRAGRQWLPLSIALSIETIFLDTNYLAFCWVYASFNQLYDELNDTFVS